MAAEVFGFRFKDLDLEGALVSWNDVIGIRLARHAYLKRDGAEQEPMGAEPGRFTMRLALMGPNWAANYRALVASIRKEPRGLLVHPLLGNLRVACHGISDASSEPGRAKRLLEVTLGFEEDALDTTVVAESFTAPAAAAARVNAQAAKFQKEVAPSSTSTGLGKVLATVTRTSAVADTLAVAAAKTIAGASAALLSATNAYSTAVQAVASGALDPSLPAKLTACGLATDAAVEALLDPALMSRPGARAQPAVSAAVELYAACVQLDVALAATRPPLIPYTLDGATNLFVLAARLYPGQAILRANDILALNRVPNPFSVPVGTVLQLARPTAP